MGKTYVVVGPQDHGRRMSLEDFDHAEATPGPLFELSRGVITFSDVPGFKHLAQVNALRMMLAMYDLSHANRIHTVAGGSECKLLLWDLQSERHPDITVYRTAPPDGDDPWSRWVPEIVIEVVSPSSTARDYEQKPEEYLAFGVTEYWIVDAAKEEVLVLRRKGEQWTETILKADAKYRPRALPDFELDVAAVFEAERQA
jgi:Uma2 family endonuclease